MSQKSQIRPAQRNQFKCTFFRIVTVFLALVFLVVLEILLRYVGAGENLSLFINHPDKNYADYMCVNPEIGKKYFHNYKNTHTSNDIFYKNKPDSVFRIFVIGSSTAEGFPYGNNLMLSRILSKRLEDVYSNRKIEIVNTAISSINSNALLDFMQPILNQNPDAILMYFGHNEYYDSLNILSDEMIVGNKILLKLHYNMMNYRIYQILRTFINSMISKFEKSDIVQNPLISKANENSDIIYGSGLYNKGIKNYSNNLDLMLAMAKKSEVPVLISNLVSNMSGIRPFKSFASNGLKRAEVYYTSARSFEAHGDFAKAYEYYTYARDYDCVRLRASSDINIEIEKKVKKHSVILVPTLQMFEENSRSGIIGNDLMIDHVHPNIKGQFLLAESFFKTIISSKIIDYEISINNIKPLDYSIINYGYSNLDILYAKHRISNMKQYWPYKDETIDSVSYKKNYQPVSQIDSLAFFAIFGNSESLLNAHEILANKYENDGDMLSAFKEFNAMVHVNPYSAYYNMCAADCLYKMGDLNGALKYYKEANIYSESYLTHIKIGEIYMIKNDLEMAITHYEMAKLLVNENNKLNLNIKLYIAYSIANEYEKAKIIYSELNRIEKGIEIIIPTNAFTFNKYVPQQVRLQIDDADEYIERGKLGLAEASLLKSLSIYDTPIANFKLGELYFKKSEPIKSIYYLQKVYSDYKADATYLHTLIEVYIRNENIDEAKLALTQLKKINPHYFELEKLQENIDNISLL